MLTAQLRLLGCRRTTTVFTVPPGRRCLSSINLSQGSRIGQSGYVLDRYRYIPGSRRHLSLSSLWAGESTDPASSVAVQSTSVETIASSSSTVPDSTTTLVPSADVYSSQTSLPAASTLDSSQAASDAVSQAIAVVDAGPLNYGDMAALGLVHWTPPGFFPWFLETIQVSTGCPWWVAIAAGTLAARAFVFPFALKGIRNAALLAPVQPKMAEIRDKMMEARTKGDNLMFQKTALQQQEMLKQIGVSPFSTVFTSIVQIMVQLGFFIGLRRMCELPVEQLKMGGLGWVTDLTIPDPYFILPVLNTLTINLQLLLTARDVQAASSASTPHVLNGIRLLTVFGLGFLLFMPSGLNLHLLTSVSLIAIQTMILRVPGVRATFKLPPLSSIKISQPSMRETFLYAREAFRRKVAEQGAIQAERQKRMKMVMKK